MYGAHRHNVFTGSLSVCLFLVLILCIPQPLHARSIYTTVTTYFLSLDSLIDAVTDSIASFRQSEQTGEFLVNQTIARPEINYIIRTNSDGKIENKVTHGKIMPANNRFVGNQGWHKTTELSKKPYYSIISERQVLYLFWCKPILKYSRHASRFDGTVAAKINLHECFETLAQSNNIAFQILFNDETFFTNILDSSHAGHLIEQRLAIYGIRGLVIRYPEAKYKPVAADNAASQVATTPSVVDHKETAAKSAGVQPDNKLAKVTSSVPATSPGRQVVLILIAVLCIGVLIACFVMMKNVADKRQKFLEAVERGEI